MNARTSWLIALAAALSLSACEPDAAKAKAKEAANELSDQAKAKAQEAASELGEQARDKAGELADEAVDKSKDLWAERSGQLSDGAKDMLAKGASASGDSVEAIVHKGVQVAPVAFDVAKTLHGSVDADIDIEPIVQKLDDEQAQAELDRRIADMPRVETIEGLDVGFKDVTQWDTSGRKTESAYLILWRSEARLFGLVYRSHKDIQIDKMVEEAPRLISLVQGVV